MNYIFLKILLLCIFLAGNIVPTFSADTLSLDESKVKEVIINKQYALMLEDTAGALSFEQVIKSTNFKQPDYFFNKNKKSVYWIRVSIRNMSGPFSTYVLENYYHHTKDIRIYFTDDGKNYVQRSGEAISYSKRDYRHKNILLDLPLPKDEKARIFYIRVQSKLYTDFNFRIKSLHYFTYYTISEYALLGIYYGILLIMMLYNFILFVSIRYHVYLLYILYIFAGILVSLNEDKLGYQYLWPEHPELNPLLAYFISPMLLVIGFILYSTEFLELRKREFKWYIGIWGLFLLYTIGFTVNFFYSIENIVRILYFLPFLAIFISSIKVYIKGYKYSRFFMMGASLILLSIFLIQLRAEGIIVGTIFTVYVFNYSLVAECLILSVALADKIRIIQKEKEKAQTEVIRELEENRKLQNLVNIQYQEKQQLQEKVNRELETKVTERTIELKRKKEELEVKSGELEISNAKLHALIEQANNMNIKLDIDNWELKKNVQQELFQRITGDEVSFDVFRSVFKDEKTGLRFLEEIKWAKGFVCKKCGYDKFKDPDNSMIRKCSRCGYPESVTSGTLLHGIKFPVNSALYLVYLIHKRRGKIKLEEIAEISEISTVSASKFKNKIIDKMNELEKRKKNITWEEIIF